MTPWTWRPLGGDVAIPDSEHYYPIDEGSGSTFADSEGDADGDLVGDVEWVSGDWVGGYGLETPAIDGEGLRIDSDRASIGDEGTVAFSIDIPSFTPETGSLSALFYSEDSDGDRNYIRTADDDGSSGEITPHLDDESLDDASFTGDNNTKYRLVLTWKDGDYTFEANAGDVHSYSGTYDGTVDLSGGSLWAFGDDFGGSDFAIEITIGSAKFSSVYWDANARTADFEELPWS